MTDEKTPGKLKSEWESTSGSIIALCNKMYMCIDHNKASEKRSTKGIIIKCEKFINVELRYSAFHTT